jgi:hypothetical protein
VAKGKAVVVSAPDQIAKAVAEITAGKRSLSIPIRERPDVVADLPQLGYALLTEALYDMNPWEVGFAGSMVKMGAPTPRQRKVIAHLAKTYLGLDIDGETVTESAPAPARAA